MAKISARGAKEVARIKVRSHMGLEYEYVLTSDGRILWKAKGGTYTVRARVRGTQKYNRDTLVRIAKRDGMCEITNG